MRVSSPLGEAITSAKLPRSEVDNGVRVVQKLAMVVCRAPGRACELVGWPSTGLKRASQSDREEIQAS